MDSININSGKNDLDLSINDDGRFHGSDTINLQQGSSNGIKDDLDLNLISNPAMRNGGSGGSGGSGGGGASRRPNYSSDEDDGYRRRHDDDDDSDDSDDDLELPPDFDESEAYEDDDDDDRHHHRRSSHHDRRDDDRHHHSSSHHDDRHDDDRRDNESDYDDDRASEDSREEEEHPHRMTYEEILKEKLKLIRRSRILRSRGYLPQTSGNRDWTVMDEYEDMKMEVEARDRMHRDDKSLGWWRQGTSWFSTGIQWANDKFDPIGVNINGFADDMDDELEKGEFDDIFLELDEKYSDKVKMAPEIRLVFGVGQVMGKRAFMNHFGRQMAPDLRTVVENNPDIMNRIMEASHEQFRRDNGMAPSAHGLGDMKIPQAPPPTQTSMPGFDDPEEAAMMREMTAKAETPRMSAQNRLRPPVGSSNNRPMMNNNIPSSHNPPGSGEGGNRLGPRPEVSKSINRDGGMNRANQLHGVLGKLGAEVDDMSDGSDDSVPVHRPPPSRANHKIGHRVGARKTASRSNGRTLELNFSK